MDLDSEYDPFSDAIKAAVDRCDRCCRPEDDRNWFVLTTPRDLEKVRELAKRFGFDLSEELKEMLRWEPVDEDRRFRAIAC